MPKSARASSRRKSTSHSKGLVRVPARLQRWQAAALEREAKRRMGERRRGRIDVSEVIRDAVSVWMAIRPGQRAIISAFAAKQELTGPEVLRKALDAWITSLDPRED